ncbi:tyrosine-type recombinase/integrase [Cellulosilyticum ruminicola]|uniref:tyrosine-type recombinase/integrase n=1 Tax=Cellulosilyticum ruminicola TaxID=425254 RepID=UPI0006D224B9|nr:tyrosine-type recombinase/integrase [Cellulosilyticum ruminicola]
MQIEKAIFYFLESLESEQLSNHSIRAYSQDLNQFMKWTNKEELDMLGFEDFQDYFISIKGLKLTSIKRKRVVLHRFMKYCYRKQLCLEKLYEYIDPIKNKKTVVPKEVLTKEEIVKLFNYLNSEIARLALKKEQSYYHYLYYCAIRNRLLVSILLYTGCRAHEAVALKKQDINLIGQTILLFTKGGKYNQIPIHEDLMAAFEEYEQALETLEKDFYKQLDESIYLFPSKNNNAAYLSTRTLHDLMNKLSEVMGRHIHAHLFRHTFASYCIAANMDISTISSLISHSNPSITLSIYTHEIDAHNKQEQIKKLSFQ